MRFVYYDDQDTGQAEWLGLDLFGLTYDLAAVIESISALEGLPAPPVPAAPWDYHAYTPEQKAQLQAIVDAVMYLDREHRGALVRRNIRRLAPVPRPSSVRCFSAFEEHVKNARQRHGQAMPDAWYEAPSFYFGNHNAIYGPGEEVPRPASFWLDYELEVACVIGQAGINIPAEKADEYIVGYAILNDWSARDLQVLDQQVGMGPSKGKDFAISLGPALVTPDELEDHAIGEGAQKRYDLTMRVKVNERLLSEGNFRSIHFTFAQMIERASADVMLYPGDVFASGVVAGGCLLDLGVEATLGRWLREDDVVDLQVEVLGTLRNAVGPPRV